MATGRKRPSWPDYVLDAVVVVGCLVAIVSAVLPMPAPARGMFVAFPILGFVATVGYVVDLIRSRRARSRP